MARHRPRRTAHVHQNDRAVLRGEERRGGWIVMQAGHVVDDRCASIQRGAHGIRMPRIDRDGGACANQGTYRRQDATLFIGRRDRLSPRPRALATHLDNLGSLLQQS